jgi:hypothetical protein
MVHVGCRYAIASRQSDRFPRSLQQVGAASEQQYRSLMGKGG